MSERDQETPDDDVDIPFAQRLSCTVKQACVATGLSRTTIYEAIGEKKIETTKVRRRRLLFVASLQEFIRKGGEPQVAA